MATVLSSSYPINVVTNGDDRRPALLLINPLGTTVEFWEPLMDKLLERFFVIRFDLRGHGASLGEMNPYTINDVVADALAVLDSVEVPRTHVLGASFGGQVAITMAAATPERIDQLVVAASGVRLGPDEWWSALAESVAAGGMEAIIDGLEEIYFSHAWQQAVPDRLEHARTMTLEVNPDAFRLGIDALLNADVDPLCELVRASTLVIAGEDDPLFRHIAPTDLLQQIPDTEIVQVGGARHRVLLEQPDLLGGVIVEFLTDLDAR